MTISEELKNKIIKEVKMLKNLYDGVGIDIGNGKGLFIQVVDYGEGKEYFIELNDVDEDNTYEPCKEYNVASKFEDMEELINTIEEYIKM